MEVGNYIVCGRDHVKTAVLCPRQVGQFRRSRAGHERCTAILVATMMILSVYLPHGGYDEEDHVALLQGVRVIMEEVKGTGRQELL